MYATFARFAEVFGVPAVAHPCQSTPIAGAGLGPVDNGPIDPMSPLQGELVGAPAAICRDDPARPVVGPKGDVRHVAALKGEFPLHLTQ